MQVVELIFLIQGVLYKAGRKVLAWFGLKSNVVVEFAIGVVALDSEFLCRRRVRLIRDFAGEAITLTSSGYWNC